MLKTSETSVRILLVNNLWLRRTHLTSLSQILLYSLMFGRKSIIKYMRFKNQS